MSPPLAEVRFPGTRVGGNRFNAARAIIRGQSTQVRWASPRRTVRTSHGCGKTGAAATRAALGQLMRLVYDELHVIAARHMAREWRVSVYQTTALVSEAYV